MSPKRPRTVAKVRPEPAATASKPRIVIDTNGMTATDRERDLEREIIKLRNELSKTKSILSRLQRFDPESARLTEHQMMVALTQSNLAISEQVRELLGNNPGSGEEDVYMKDVIETQALHREIKRKQIAEVARKLAYTDRLIRADKVTTDMCSCGKHKGITFTEYGNVIEENMCPLDWWFKMSGHAFYHEYTADFERQYPYREFVREFKR